MGEYDYRTGFDDDAEDLLRRLLCLDPSKRIKVEEALEHKFFEGLKMEAQQEIKQENNMQQ